MRERALQLADRQAGGRPFRLIYVVAHGSFSVAGVASASFGLLDTATVFSAAVALLAVSALVATRRAIPASTKETPCTAPAT